MKKRHLSLLKRILVTALSVSMVLQPVAPVMAEEIIADEAEEIYAEAVEDEEILEVSGVEDEVIADDLDVAETEAEVASDSEESVETDGEIRPGTFTLEIGDLVDRKILNIDEYSLEGGELNLDSDYYTAYGHPSSTTKVKVDDSGSVTFADDYVGTAYLNLNGAVSWPSAENGMDHPTKVIKFTTTTENAVMKLWWKGNGTGKGTSTGNREWGIYAEDQSLVAMTADNIDAGGKTKCISKLTIPTPGTYYLTGVGGSNFLYKCETKEVVKLEDTLEIGKLVDEKVLEINEYDLAGGELPLNSTFFTAYGHPSSTTKVKVDDSGSVTFADDYVGTAYLNLNGAVSWPSAENGMDHPTKVIKFTTSVENAVVKIWWKGNGTGKGTSTGNREWGIYAEDQSLVAMTADNIDAGGKTKCISKLTIPTPGTYYLTGVGGSNFLYKLVVTQGAGSGEVEWADVATPSFAGFDTSEVDKIKVTVNTDIDEDTRAEYVTVYMYNEAGDLQGTAKLMKDGKDSATFEPVATGKYYFTAGAGRSDQVDVIGEDGEPVVDSEGNKVTEPKYPEKLSEASELVSFTHSVVAPSVKGTPANNGNKTVDVSWFAVADADKYTAKIVDFDNTLVETTKCAATLDTSALEVGKEYTVEVTAIRGEGLTDFDKASSTIAFTMSDKKEIPWQFSAYGTSTKNFQSESGKRFCGFIGNANDGAVRVYSVGGAGKIVPLSMDGVSFYYVPVPADKNFTISAKAHVNNWSYTNGQDGFGVMAADRVGKAGDTDYWNNAYMSVVTKSEYRWDSDNKAYTADESFGKSNMYLGVSSLGRSGVTPENLSLFEQKPDQAIAKYFTQDQTALEHLMGSAFGSGTFNIVANYVAQLKDGIPADEIEKGVIWPDYNAQEKFGTGVLRSGTITDPKYLFEDFILTVQKNNTGYVVSYTYTDPATGEEVTESKTYYRSVDDGNGLTPKREMSEADPLESLDKDYVYAGMFAARDADVTFSDIKFTTIDPEDDADREEPDYTYFDNLAKFITDEPTGVVDHTNSADYNLTYYANWEGDLELSNESGKTLWQGVIGSEQYVTVPVNLAFGSNKFKAVFTPHKDFHYGYDEEHPTAILNVLKDYATKQYTVDVNYRAYGEEGTYVYVSPEGTSDGNGTIEAPLDVQTAVRYAKPGQTILLAGGTYKMKSSVKVGRGVNGTADKPIYFMADPADNETPVFDFLYASAGFQFGGNYWYLKDFVVTNTADMQKGIQLAGSYCTLENIVAHHCGNNGIDLSRLYGTDTKESGLWPHDNLILNCTSYENADAGYEDADGFTCKLTTGENNVFDGCIAYCNADDGWDLYSKSETGEIGRVWIKNSVAYMNGYLHYEDSKKFEKVPAEKRGDYSPETGFVKNPKGYVINAGNGNGFKMGGEALYGGHTVMNCFSFYNKAKGIDSNSCPDIKSYGAVSYDNESYNLGIYTNNKKATNYELRETISFRYHTLNMTDSKGDPVIGHDKIECNEGLGQTKEATCNPTVFSWNRRDYNGSDYDSTNTNNTSLNSEGKAVKAEWFKSLDFNPETDTIGRKADGTVDMGDFLQLTDEAVAEIGFNIQINGTPNTEAPESAYNASTGTKEKADNDSDKSGQKMYPDVNYINTGRDIIYVGDIEDQYYTGQKIVPEILVVDWSKSGSMNILKAGKDYTAVYQNNVKAGTANVIVTGVGNYDGKYLEEDGSQVTFKILPISLDEGFKLRRQNAVTKIYENVEVIDTDPVISEQFKGKSPMPVVYFDNGKGLKKLSSKTDFDVKFINKATGVSANSVSAAGQYTMVITGKGNFTGTRYVDCNLYTSASNNIESAQFDVLPAQILNTKGTEPYSLTDVSGNQIFNISLGGKKLVQGVDYKVNYRKNKKRGTGVAVISGIGDYTGKVQKKFKIAQGKLAVNTVKLNVEELPKSVSYNGSPITFNNKIKVYYTGLGSDGKPSNKRLALGRDFKVVYKNHKYAGTATAMIKGVGSYTGVFAYQYQILPVPQRELANYIKDGRITITTEANVDVSSNKAYRYFKRDGGKVAVSVALNGVKLKEGKDYKLTFLNTNVTTLSPGASKPKYCVKFTSTAIKGQSDYYEYEIRPGKFDSANVSMSATDVIYKGARTRLNSKVELYEYGTKRKLRAGKDYDRELTYIIPKSVSANGVVETVSVNNLKGITLPDPGETGYDVTVIAKGKAPYYASTTVSTTIHVASNDVKKAQVKALAPIYYNTWDTSSVNITGVELPEEAFAGMVSLNGKTLEYGKDFVVATKPSVDNPGYNLKMYDRNTKAGMATVTIQGIGKYTGQRRITFQIKKRVMVTNHSTVSGNAK